MFPTKITKITNDFEGTVYICILSDQASSKQKKLLDEKVHFEDVYDCLPGSDEGQLCFRVKEPPVTLRFLQLQEDIIFRADYSKDRRGIDCVHLIQGAIDAKLKIY